MIPYNIPLSTVPGPVSIYDTALSLPYLQKRKNIHHQESSSIAPRSTLCFPQLIHLRDPLLELLILALLIRMSLGLPAEAWLACASPFTKEAPARYRAVFIPRISRAGRTLRTDTGSEGSVGGRNYLGMVAGVWLRT